MDNPQEITVAEDDTIKPGYKVAIIDPEGKIVWSVDIGGITRSQWDDPDWQLESMSSLVEAIPEETWEK